MIAAVEGSVEIVVDHVLEGTTHFSNCLEFRGDRLVDRCNHHNRSEVMLRVSGHNKKQTEGSERKKLAE